MVRALIISWLVGAALVGWLRVRAGGRLSRATARGDVTAALMMGTFIWLIWVIRF